MELILKQSFRVQNKEGNYIQLPEGIYPVKPSTNDERFVIYIPDIGERKLPYTLMQNFSGIDVPTIEELYEMTTDGYCTSIMGEDTEPDGHDSDGWPSWMLAYGFI